MKKRFLVGLLILTFSFSLIGCGKSNSNVDEINNGINNLLGNLPQDDIDIKEDVVDQDELDIEEYQEKLVEDGIATQEEIDAANDFAENVLNTSVDCLYPELNFSFGEYCTKRLPEEFELYGQTWNPATVEPCYTSLGVANPSVMMSTSFSWHTNEERYDCDIKYQALLKQLISDFGEVIGGDNYDNFGLEEFNSENSFSAMIFEKMDCYVLVTVDYREFDNSENLDKDKNSLKVAMVQVTYVSKDLYHDTEAEDAEIVEYISERTGARFNLFVKDSNTDGGFYTIPKDVKKLDIGIF